VFETGVAILAAPVVHRLRIGRGSGGGFATHESRRWESLLEIAMRAEPAIRHILIAACLGGLVSASPAAAEPREDASACPDTAISVYFASKDASVSEAAQAMIRKLGETAAACHPENIRLTVRLDPGVKGAEAELRARSHIALLVNVLVDAGQARSRIHVDLTTPSVPPVSDLEGERGRLHVVEVRFNDAPAEARRKQGSPPVAQPHGI
jgi:hypothetical protein